MTPLDVEIQEERVIVAGRVPDRMVWIIALGILMVMGLTFDEIKDLFTLSF